MVFTFIFSRLLTFTEVIFKIMYILYTLSWMCIPCAIFVYCDHKGWLFWIKRRRKYQSVCRTSRKSLPSACAESSSSSSSSEEVVNFIDTDSSDDDPCVVCLDRQRNTAIFPCGHAHLCLECVTRLSERKRPCPMCKGPITEFRQVYI